MAENQNSPTYLEVIHNLFAAKQAWKFAAFVLAGISAFLAYSLVYQARNTPVVLVPHSLIANTDRVKVATSGDIRGTSAEYMANLAMSDLSLILNFTPDNVQSQHLRFLNRVTEELYGNQKDTLTAAANDLKRRGITQSFFPSNVKVSGDSTRVEVAGTQIRWSGSTEIMRTNMTYIITYKVYKEFMQISDLRQESINEKK